MTHRALAATALAITTAAGAGCANTDRAPTASERVRPLERAVEVAARTPSLSDSTLVKVWAKPQTPVLYEMRYVVDDQMYTAMVDPAKREVVEIDRDPMDRFRDVRQALDAVEQWDTAKPITLVKAVEVAQEKLAGDVGEASFRLEGDEPIYEVRLQERNGSRWIEHEFHIRASDGVVVRMIPGRRLASAAER
jgi:uncharacterized membrane protein YkoI